MSWVTPLHRQGYLHRAPGLVWCPVCLREHPYVRRYWRLSCALVCAAPFAPLRHDLGKGCHWIHADLPFPHCSTCGERLAGPGTPAPASLLAAQRWLDTGLASGEMTWPDGRPVATVDAFGALHQLALVVLPPGLAAQLDRPNLTLEDHGVVDRRVLLARVTWLVQEWPARLLARAGLAGLTRRPLMANFPDAPAWFNQVADQLHQGNGRRAPVQVQLVAHLSPEELAARQVGVGAPSELERRRWAILCAYVACPEGLTSAGAWGCPVSS